MEIAIRDIVRKTNARSTSKVQQMRRSLRNGAKFPPIRVAVVDDMLRYKLGKLGLPTDSKYFLLEGHHRCCAAELEGRKLIKAKVVRKLY